MKILAISGTPHKNIGASTILVDQVFESIRKVDPSADCETIFLASKKIGYCTGCGICLSRGDCPQKDDMDEIMQKMSESDGLILSSPVYAFHVTAQMKTFVDRLIPYGHRPGFAGKYSLAVSVSSGWGDEAVAVYLADLLSGLGASSIGTLRATATGPGMFRDQEAAMEQADRMGRQLASAIIEKWNFPQSSIVSTFRVFLVDLIQKYPSLFKEDCRYWEEKGFIKK
jgi:multimeric flavodoxin WrbA